MKRRTIISAIISLAIVSAGISGLATNAADKTISVKSTSSYTENAAGKWIKDTETGKWWYRHTDGSYTRSNWEKIDNVWYYFDADGWMKTGWLQLGDKWYYLNPSGAMQTGWRVINNQWYYFNPTGDMHTGWKEDNGKWYYLNSNGAMQTGWRAIDNKWYYFNKANGEMLTGWQDIDGETYYFYANGILSNSKFRNGSDNWSFGNFKCNFGNRYFINPDHLTQLFSGLKNNEKASIIDQVLNTEWHGSCFGMAITSILASNGKFPPSYLQKSAVSLNDIVGPPSPDVQSLINYYYALQCTKVVNEAINNTIGNGEWKYDQLISCLKDGSPTLLIFHGPDISHAIVAYDVEYGKFVIGNKTYNCRIMTYDNNSVVYDESYCLYFNTSNSCWSIPAYDLNTENGGKLGLITDDLDLLNYHGYFNGSTYYDAPSSNYNASLYSAKIAGEYNLTRIPDNNPNYTEGASSDEDIIEYSPISDYRGQSSSVIFSLKDSDAAYELELAEPEPLDLSLSYENSLLAADVSSGSLVSFSPSDKVYISGQNTNYDLRIVLNDGYMVTDWYSLSVSGTGVNDASLEKTDNGYILQASNLNNVRVDAHNDEIAAKVIFSTEYTRVFLFEKDEDTIGIAVDTDNNGTFETELTVDPSCRN